MSYNPGYFVSMIEDRGALGACRKLINDTSVSDGFTKLCEMGRLDLTVEAVALRSPYNALFTAGERLKSRKRLEEYGYKP